MITLVGQTVCPGCKQELEWAEMPDNPRGGKEEPYLVCNTDGCAYRNCADGMTFTQALEAKAGRHGDDRLGRPSNKHRRRFRVYGMTAVEVHAEDERNARKIAAEHQDC
jgi:uncharacterized protein YbaR (Trm112 family)